MPVTSIFDGLGHRIQLTCKPHSFAAVATLAPAMSVRPSALYRELVAGGPAAPRTRMQEFLFTWIGSFSVVAFSAPFS